MMTKEQLKAMNEVIIPFHLKELSLRNHYSNRFPTDGARNWLVKRAYELGFDVELHGQGMIVSRKIGHLDIRKTG